MNEIPDHVLKSVISRRLIYAEVDADDAVPRSIFLHQNKNPAKMEILKACNEIEERMSAYVY